MCDQRDAIERDGVGMEIGLLGRQGARDHAEIGEALAGVVDPAARSTGLDIDLDPGRSASKRRPSSAVSGAMVLEPVKTSFCASGAA